jgi:hypothetical protein
MSLPSCMCVSEIAIHNYLYLSHLCARHYFTRTSTNNDLNHASYLSAFICLLSSLFVHLHSVTVRSEKAWYWYFGLWSLVHPLALVLTSQARTPSPPLFNIIAHSLDHVSVSVLYLFFLLPSACLGLACH